MVMDTINIPELHRSHRMWITNKKKIKMSKPKPNECDGLCAIAAATDHVNMQTVAQPMETAEGFALNQNRFMDLFKSFWMNMYELIMHMSTK